MKKALTLTMWLIAFIAGWIMDGSVVRAAEPVACVATSSPLIISPAPSNDMAATLACIRSYEGGYTSVNPAGYYGAYQFAQGTWNSTANAAGRPDLVGVNPATAAPADQDAMAVALIGLRGLQPWPTPNRLCR